MPLEIRTSQRAAAKKLRSNDISLDTDLTFLFFFHSDRTYMLFSAVEETWADMLNSKKICLKRGDKIKFPKFGEGVHQAFGPSRIMLKLGEFMTAQLDKPDCVVSDLDITGVLKKINEEFNDENERENINDENEDLDEEDSESSDDGNLKIAPKAKKPKLSQSTAGHNEIENCAKCASSTERSDAEKLVCEKTLHVLSRIEQRLEKSNKVQNEILSLARKSIKEVDGLMDASMERGDNQYDSAVVEVWYNDKCLTNLGGDTPEDKARKIARALWTKTELSKIVLDPRKELKSEVTGREKADEEQMLKFREAVKSVLGSQYSKKIYRRLVRLINVMGNGYKNKGFINSDSD